MNNGCPKCNNKIGFSFGTCTECGWNYLDNSYHYITINVDYIPKNIRAELVKIHDTNIQRRNSLIK